MVVWVCHNRQPSTITPAQSMVEWAAMLLAVDVGNTNLHLGVYHGEELVGDWRVRTERNRTGDEHGVLFQALLQTAGLGLADLGGVAISNVVPPLAPALRFFARRYVGREAEFVGEGLRPELPVRYMPPAAVG